jgi:hypothetical protein
MIYMREMMRTSFSETISGPGIVGRGTMRKLFPNMKGVHSSWGVQLHEIQMNDSRQAL